MIEAGGSGVKAAITAAAASQAFEGAQEHMQEFASDHFDRLRAKQRAVKYAHQTKGRLAHVQFHDGHERWVILKNNEPIASFPPFHGDLGEALREHERIRVRTPAAVRATLPLEKLRHAGRRVARRMPGNKDA